MPANSYKPGTAQFASGEVRTVVAFQSTGGEVKVTRGEVKVTEMKDRNEGDANH